MTNKDQRNAVRAYMREHGVNYTTALRAITTRQPDNPAPVRAVWEQLRDLTATAKNLHLPEHTRDTAATEYQVLRDVIISEQTRRIEPFLDNLTGILTPSASALIDRRILVSDIEDIFNARFDTYWATATYDQGYQAAATLHMGLGIIGWLNSPHGPLHQPAPTPHNVRDRNFSDPIETLWDDYITADRPTGEHEDALTRHYLPYATQVAQRVYFIVGTANVDQDDFVQTGYIALLEAIRTYRPDNSAGASFQTYANRMIKMKLIDMVRGYDHQPRTTARPQHISTIAHATTHTILEELSRITSVLNPTRTQLGDTPDWRAVHDTATAFTTYTDKTIYLFGTIAGATTHALAAILDITPEQVTEHQQTNLDNTQRN